MQNEGFTLQGPRQILEWLENNANDISYMSVGNVRVERTLLSPPYAPKKDVLKTIKAEVMIEMEE